MHELSITTVPSGSTICRVFGNDHYTLHFPDNAPIKDVMDVIVRVTGKHAYRIEGDNCYFYNK